MSLRVYSLPTVDLTTLLKANVYYNPVNRTTPRTTNGYFQSSNETSSTKYETS